MIELVVNQSGDTVTLLNPLDACEYANVSTQTLNAWRREGWLSSFPVGRGHLYTYEMLDAALHARNKDREKTRQEVRDDRE